MVNTREQTQVELAELIGERPAVLIFLRHFGCIGCTAQFMQRHNLAATLGARSIWRRVRATGAGAVGYLGSGDKLQQGGSIMLDQDGSAALYFASESVGDNVNLNEVVVTALRLGSNALAGDEDNDLCAAWQRLLIGDLTEKLQGSSGARK